MSPGLKEQLGPALFEHEPSPVVVIDAGHRIVLANPAFKRIFGDREGEPCFRVYKRSEEVCEQCPVDQVFVEQSVQTSEQDGVDHEGNARVLRVCAMPLPENGQRVEQVLHLCQDVTRLVELERSMDQAERLANVGLTTAGLAHTIKNILAGLEGGIYVVNSGLDKEDSERLKAGWGMVQRYIEQVASLVQNLLRYARAQEPVREEVPPAQLVDRVVELFASKAELTGIQLEGHADEDLPAVRVDPEGMHACLTNLVANAMDACTWDPEAEDKEHRIDLRARQEQDSVVFEVQDNGMGISAEDQPKILNLHFTTKGIRGTGLGLLLTKKAVEEHGGTISFESEQGRGTTFRIELPLSG